MKSRSTSPVAALMILISWPGDSTFLRAILPAGLASTEIAMASRASSGLCCAADLLQHRRYLRLAVAESDRPADPTFSRIATRRAATGAKPDAFTGDTQLWLAAVRADRKAPSGTGIEQDLLHGRLVNAGELNPMEGLARVDRGDLGCRRAVLEANVGGHLLGTRCCGGFAKVVDVDPRS